MASNETSDPQTGQTYVIAHRLYGTATVKVIYRNQNVAVVQVIDGSLAGPGRWKRQGDKATIVLADVRWYPKEE